MFDQRRITSNVNVNQLSYDASTRQSRQKDYSATFGPRRSKLENPYVYSRFGKRLSKLSPITKLTDMGSTMRDTCTPQSVANKNNIKHDYEGNLYFVDPSMISDPYSLRTEYQVANINQYRHDNIQKQREFKRFQNKSPEVIESRNPNFIKRVKEEWAQEEQMMKEKMEKENARQEYLKHLHFEGLNTIRYSNDISIRKHFKFTPIATNVSVSKVFSVDNNTSQMNDSGINSKHSTVRSNNRISLNTKALNDGDEEEEDTTHCSQNVNIFDQMNKTASQFVPGQRQSQKTGFSTKIFKYGEIKGQIDKTIRKLRKQGFETMRNRSELPQVQRINKYNSVKVKNENMSTKNSVSKNSPIKQARQSIVSERPSITNYDQSIFTNNVKLDTDSQVEINRIPQTHRQFDINDNHCYLVTNEDDYQSLFQKKLKVMDILHPPHSKILTGKVTKVETPIEMKTIQFKPILPIQSESQSSKKKFKNDRSDNSAVMTPNIPYFKNKKMSTSTNSSKQLGNDSRNHAQFAASSKIGSILKSSIKSNIQQFRVVEEKQIENDSDLSDLSRYDLENLDEDQIQRLKDRKKKTRQFKITDEPNVLIQKLDELIEAKHQKQKNQILQKVQISLKLKQQGQHHNINPSFEYYPYIKACMDMNLNLGKFNWNFVSQISLIIAKIFQERRERNIQASTLKGNMLDNLSIKDQPEIVVEILQEIDSTLRPNQQVRLCRLSCECRLKNYCKQFIRKLRGYPNNFMQLREQYKKGDYDQVKCQHHEEEECKDQHHYHMIMLKWFDNFIDEIQFKKIRKKINKQDVFNSFVKIMVNEPSIEPKLSCLQEWIKDNNLQTRQDIDFSSFAEYNSAMGLKLKKPEKLNKEQNEQRMIQENSKDSSSESENDDRNSQQSNMKNRYLLKVPTNYSKIDYLSQASMMRSDTKSVFTSKKAPKKQEVKQNQTTQIYSHAQERIQKMGILESQQQVDLTLDQDIKVDKVMYKNFISSIYETEEIKWAKRQESLGSVSLSDSDRDEKGEFQRNAILSQEEFQQGILNSYKATLKSLQNLKNEREQQQLQHKIKKGNKNQQDQQTQKVQPEVEKIRSELESKLSDQIYEYQNLASTQHNKIKNKLRPISISSGTEDIEIMRKTTNQIKFYQYAKDQIIHANSDKINAQEKLFTDFFQYCEKQGMRPNPAIFKIIENKQLKIQNFLMTDQINEGLNQMITQGLKQELREFQIEMLYIDEPSMNDEKIAGLLEKFKDADSLKSITIKNCQIGEKTIGLLDHFLRITTQDFLQELRLVNIKNFDKYQELKDQLIEAISQTQFLTKLQLSYMDLNSKPMIEVLTQLLKYNVLTEFDISNCFINIQNMNQICSQLTDCDPLVSCNLSGITCFYMAKMDDDKLMQQEEMPHKFHENIYQKKSVQNIAFEHLLQFIETSPNLQHIDLSYMMLQDKILKLQPAIANSQSLLSCHLSGNELPSHVLKEFLVKMGIDYHLLDDKIDQMTSINHQLISPPTSNTPYKPTLSKAHTPIKSESPLKRRTQENYMISDPPHEILYFDIPKTQEVLDIIVRLGEYGILGLIPDLEYKELMKILLRDNINNVNFDDKWKLKFKHLEESDEQNNIDHQILNSDDEQEFAKFEKHELTEEEKQQEIQRILQNPEIYDMKKQLRQMEWDHMQSRINNKNESPEKSLKNYFNFNIKSEFKQKVADNNKENQKMNQNLKLETDLIITRKIGHNDLVFNQFMHNTDVLQKNFLNFDDIESKWKVISKKEMCYFCNKHRLVRIFYRRNDEKVFFKPVKCEQTIAQIKYMMPSGLSIDKYKNLPFIIGKSFFEDGISCSKMIQAKHSALFQWAEQFTMSYKGPQENILEFIKNGIYKIIQQDFKETDKTVFDEIQLLMSNWRKYMFPTEAKEGQLTLNIPYFNQFKPEEDDIFVFQGYVQPGVHKIYIFDPITKEFLESKSVIVSERHRDTKFSNLPDKTDENQEIPGTTQAIRSHLFKDLQYDYMKQISLLAYKEDKQQNDLFHKIELPDINIKYIKKIVKQKYDIFVILWKLFLLSLINSNESPQDHIVYFISQIFDRESEDLQVIPRKIIEKACSTVLGKKNDGILIQRVDMIKIFFEMIINFKIKHMPNDPYDDVFNIFVDQVLSPFISQNYDIYHSRKFLIFENKYLLTLLNDNYKVLLDLYNELKESYEELFTIDGQSLMRLPFFFQSNPQMNDLQNMQLLAHLCEQSKFSMTLKHHSLMFEEFLLFLIHCGMHISLIRKQFQDRSRRNSQMSGSKMSRFNSQVSNSDNQNFFLHDKPIDQFIVCLAAVQQQNGNENLSNQLIALNTMKVIQHLCQCVINSQINVPTCLSPENIQRGTQSIENSEAQNQSQAN